MPRACRGVDSRPFCFQVTTLGRLFARSASVTEQYNIQFGTGQRSVISRDWEDDRRSGLALTMHHRLHWFTVSSTYTGSRPEQMYYIRGRMTVVHEVNNV